MWPSALGQWVHFWDAGGTCGRRRNLVKYLGVCPICSHDEHALDTQLSARVRLSTSEKYIVVEEITEEEVDVLTEVYLLSDRSMFSVRKFKACRRIDRMRANLMGRGAKGSCHPPTTLAWCVAITPCSQALPPRGVCAGGTPLRPRGGRRCCCCGWRKHRRGRYHHPTPQSRHPGALHAHPAATVMPRRCRCRVEHLSVTAVSLRPARARRVPLHPTSPPISPPLPTPRPTPSSPPSLSSLFTGH